MTRDEQIIYLFAILVLFIGVTIIMYVDDVFHRKGNWF